MTIVYVLLVVVFGLVAGVDLKLAYDAYKSGQRWLALSWLLIAVMWVLIAIANIGEVATYGTVRH